MERCHHMRLSVWICFCQVALAFLFWLLEVYKCISMCNSSSHTYVLGVCARAYTYI